MSGHPAAAGLATPSVGLEPGVRDLVSSSYGHDFSRVRVHAGREAGDAAHRLGAKAFTVGHDIVFGQGAYDPLSADGRALIAHELAHVVQHGGHDRAPSFSTLLSRGPLPRVEHRMEAQADAAAAQVDRPLPRDWSWERSTQPCVATAEADWRPPPAPYTVTYAGENRPVTAEQWLEDAPEVARVQLGEFVVPAAKGPWGDMYDGVAKGQGLQATLDVSRAAIRTAQWQQRAASSELRRLWLLRVSWPQAEAAQWWYDAGGLQGDRSFVPKTASDSHGSQIDHIVELQLGGTNVPDNLAPHDAGDNAESGRTIWQQVREAGQQVAEVISARPGGTRLSQVTLQWSSARMAGDYRKPTAPLPVLPADESAQAAVIAARRGTAGSSLQVHFTALADKAAGTRPGPRERRAAEEHRGTLRNYPIAAGPVAAVLLVDPATTSDLIENSPIPENAARSELISGLVLERLSRARSGDRVTGWLNSVAHPVRSGTRLPLQLQGIGERLDFHVNDVGNTGRLTLPETSRPIRFTYPYLSAGEIRLRMTDTGLAGHGTITPSVPLLSRVPITIDLDEHGLRGSVRPSRDQLRLPPFRLTDTALTVTLAPELSAGGFVAFSLGTLLDGRLEAAVDASGFHAEGDLNAHIPSLDAATAHVAYRPSTGLSGTVVVAASSRGPLVTGGQVTLEFAGSNWSVTGRLSLQIPGGGPAELSVAKRNDTLVYTGRARMTVPGLHPVDAELSYDGEHLNGSASTTFTLLGANGDIALRYRNGHFSGDGHIALARGRFSGSLDAHLDEDGRLSGRGQGQLEIRPGLVGTVGVEYTRDHHLHLSGELRFPPYRFLERRGGEFPLFHHDLPDIPIFAIPLGVTSIGLVARIGGGLTARYSFGPGEFRDMVISGSFDPLEEDTAAEIAAQARIVLPAEAGLELFVDATVGVSAAVASVTGGIRVTGGAMLRGGLEAGVQLSYGHGVLVFDTQARISVQPTLTLGIDAEVIAEASLIGEKRWAYNLASYSYATGLMFGMVAPFHYQSDQPLRLPQASDIQWIVPEIDVGALASQIADRVESGLGL